MRHQLGGDLLAVVAYGGLCAAEALVVRACRMALDELTDLVDDGDRVQVAVALRVAPGEEAMAAEDHTVAVGSLRDDFAEHHAELEAGALPGKPGELVAELCVEL